MDYQAFAQNVVSGSLPCQSMGLRIRSVDKGECSIVMPYAPFFLTAEGGSIHGGAITVLTDVTAGMSAITAIDGLESFATLDLRIDHVCATRPGYALVAYAKCSAVTAQCIFVRTEVYQADTSERLVAISTGTFIRRASYQSASMGDHNTAKLNSNQGPPDELFDRTYSSSFDKWLGLQESRIDENEMYLLRSADHLMRNRSTSVMHGGVVGGYLEAVALAYLTKLTGLHATTINTTTSYHSFAGPFDIYAQPHVTRRGRRVATIRIESWQKLRTVPTAHMLGHFLLSDSSSG